VLFDCTTMRRRREPELMDDPNADPRAHRSALAALRRSNRWLGFDAVLVKKFAAMAPAGEVSMLEIGSGGGGFIEALAAYDQKTAGRRQANGKRQTNGQLRLIGVDRSRFAISDAQAHLGKSIVGSGHKAFSLVAGDALRLPFGDRSADVVVCALLLHHFDPAGAVRLLREAARVARHAVVIGDLDRSSAAWLLTWVVTRLMSRSRLFHVDGPRSVRAAYRPAEALRLAAQAGLAAANVRAVFPFRWTLVWRREAP
jgi:ubiquinone/menaquinone biosynthesis C-methylase UbiE